MHEFRLLSQICRFGAGPDDNDAWELRLLLLPLGPQGRVRGCCASLLRREKKESHCFEAGHNFGYALINFVVRCPLGD